LLCAIWGLVLERVVGSDAAGLGTAVLVNWSALVLLGVIDGKTKPKNGGWATMALL